MVRRKRKPISIRKTADGRLIRSGKKYLLPDGRYRIDCRSTGGGRLTFETEAEADAALEGNTAKESKGESRINGASATFGDAIELLRTRPREKRLTKGSRDSMESALSLLQAQFGTFTLKALVEAELQPMQDFFSQRICESESGDRLKYIRTLISRAFKIAIGKHWLTAHPLDQFELVVPFKEGPKRPTLSLAQISALARAALLRTKQDRSEITWSNRQLMFFLTLLTPMRNEEAAGLCWDRLDMVHRTFLINRIVREGDNGDELVDDTKTGMSGERTVPMPPFLVPVIEQHRLRLIARGMPVEGRVPLLVPGQRLGNGLVTPRVITTSHWPTLVAKAGVSLPTGLQFYIMRHTATNLLKSVGMDRDDLIELGGWTSGRTLDEHYRHPTPEYKQALRPEVEAMALRFGFDLKSTEGLVDALGYVLVARWNHEGIKVQCAPPRQRQRSPLEAALLGVDEAAPLALPAPPVKDTAPTFPSVEAVRLWQIGESVRLYREDGWTRTRIAAHLHVDGSTVGSWLRDANIPHTRGSSGISNAERAEKRQKLDELHMAHPELSNDELGLALGLRPTLVSRWLRKSGATPAPRKMPYYKLGKHEQKIRAWVAAGKTCREMAKLLGDGISFSAIATFVRKLGLRTKRWGSGERVDQYDADIRRLAAEGKDGQEIADELHTVSHSSINRRIKKLGLRTDSEKRAAAAKARAKKVLRRQQLAAGSGTNVGTAENCTAKNKAKSAA